MSALLEKLSTLKIIPVIAIKNADDAVALGRALMDNGMPSAEITFRTPAAADERAFVTGRWQFDDDKINTLHHLGTGNFVASGRHVRANTPEE